MPKTHEAIVRARSLLDALDQQLTAATEAETEDARDRVAMLSFGLTALLDHLGAHPPDNDEGRRRPLVQLHEAIAAGHDRRFVVAQFAARWFVLTGYTQAPLSTYGVLGPYDHARDARDHVLRLHSEAIGIALWPTQKVVEA